ncbi:MAG: hypothetical protein KGL98_10245 [Gammaproteobacteria bacterium]|nr:hypothetical protein [Gammaproteobacteria bacterium]MDE2461614.1 hypothetical protein [Gammaproteobacteria bacterium]
MFRRLIHVAGLSLIAAALLGASQCGKTSNNGVGPNGALFVTTLAVEDANGNAAGSFTPGQQIQFVLSVRNRSTSSQTVSFNTSEQSNFAVFESGTATEVWTWSLGQVFGQTATTLTWQPGETRTFTVTWSQVNDSNQLVSPGNYEAMAGLACVNSGSSSSSSSSSTANNCMPTAVPGSGDLVPSVYVSTLVPFTVQ